MSGLASVNVALDAGLAVRVAAHQARLDGVLAVAQYLDLLRLVRRMENVLEPCRRAYGATCSRAFELCTTDEQLNLDVAA